MTPVSPSPTPSASSSSSNTAPTKSSSSPSPTPPTPSQTPSTPNGNIHNNSNGATPKSMKRRSYMTSTPTSAHKRQQSVIAPSPYAWNEILSKHPIYPEYKLVKDRLASAVNSLRVPGGHGLLHYDEHCCLTSEKEPDFALLLVRCTKFPKAATRAEIYEAENELKRRMLRKGTQLALVLVDRDS